MGVPYCDYRSALQGWESFVECPWTASSDKISMILWWAEFECQGPTTWDMVLRNASPVIFAPWLCLWLVFSTHSPFDFLVSVHESMFYLEFWTCWEKDLAIGRWERDTIRSVNFIVICALTNLQLVSISSSFILSQTLFENDLKVYLFLKSHDIL